MSGPSNGPRSVNPARIRYFCPTRCDQECAYPCPLCGSWLYLEWCTSQAILTSSTPETDGFTPTDAHTSAWRVACESGHVVAVSQGTEYDETADNPSPFTMDAIPVLDEERSTL